MRKYFIWLPNALTLCNLILGCVAIQYALDGNLLDATFFIMMAVVFDFFDGFAARAMQSFSPIGKDLDSLADMVSFGVAPTFLLYGLASHANYDNWVGGNPQILGYICFSVAAASALRLAKFNNDERQTFGFIGLPTPANALFISGLIWIAANPESVFAHKLTSPYIILGIVLLCCWLPLSKISMIALKFKTYSIKDNLTKYILLIAGAAFLVLFQGAGLFYSICLYIIVSVIENTFTTKNETY